MIKFERKNRSKLFKFDVFVQNVFIYTHVFDQIWSKAVYIKRIGFEESGLERTHSPRVLGSEDRPRNLKRIKPKRKQKNNNNLQKLKRGIGNNEKKLN